MKRVPCRQQKNDGEHTDDSLINCEWNYRRHQKPKASAGESKKRNTHQILLPLSMLVGRMDVVDGIGWRTQWAMVKPLHQHIRCTHLLRSRLFLFWFYYTRSPVWLAFPSKQKHRARTNTQKKLNWEPKKLRRIRFLRRMCSYAGNKRAIFQQIWPSTVIWFVIVPVCRIFTLSHSLSKWQKADTFNINWNIFFINLIIQRSEYMELRFGALDLPGIW